MTHRTLIQTVLAAAALMGASAAFAATDANGTAVTTPVKHAYQVSVAQQSNYINVNGGDVVSFSLADGSKFNWKFDGNNNYVNLADIAPQNVQVPDQFRVYVNLNDDSGNDDSSEG